LSVISYQLSVIQSLCTVYCRWYWVEFWVLCWSKFR